MSGSGGDGGGDGVDVESEDACLDTGSKTLMAGVPKGMKEELFEAVVSGHHHIAMALLPNNNVQCFMIAVRTNVLCNVQWKT